MYKHKDFLSKELENYKAIVEYYHDLVKYLNERIHRLEETIREKGGEKHALRKSDRAKG